MISLTELAPNEISPVLTIVSLSPLVWTKYGVPSAGLSLGLVNVILGES